MRSVGKVPADLLRPMTIEKMLDIGLEYRNRREAIETNVVQGRIPWLLAEQLLRNPSCWAWTVRTQSFPWLLEEPLSVAAYTIYATNAFTVKQSEPGARLKRIVASGAGTPVVVDLSSLLTLHNLGRLDAIANYFGHILLPSTYGDLRSRDANRFGDHQPMRTMCLQAVQEQVERHRIRIIESGVNHHLIVDEDTDGADGHVYRLNDLLMPLFAAQKVSTSMRSEIVKFARKPLNSDDGHPPLALGSEVCIALESLRSLAGQQIFNTVIESFVVCMHATDRDKMVAELHAREALQDAKAAHVELWDKIEEMRKKATIVFTPVPQSEVADNDSEIEDGPLETIELDALRLAERTTNPLLADDRVLQVAMLQKFPKTCNMAFGTAHSVLELLGSGRLSIAEAAKDFLRLMSWRYRFLVVPSEMLHHWARQSFGALPGDELLSTAVYLHDCLRDPGLHCGPEATQPPSPMAGSFVTAWIVEIAAFLSKVWSDEEFSDDSASRITRWAGEEMAPSCPQGLRLNQIGLNLDRILPRGMVSMALVRFAAVPDSKRANLGLRILADSLGMDDDKYLTVVTESIDELA